jgi:hypothetical protein
MTFGDSDGSGGIRLTIVCVIFQEWRHETLLYHYCLWYCVTCMCGTFLLLLPVVATSTLLLCNIYIAWRVMEEYSDGYLAVDWREQTMDGVWRDCGNNAVTDIICHIS